MRKKPLKIREKRRKKNIKNFLRSKKRNSKKKWRLLLKNEMN